MKYFKREYAGSSLLDVYLRLSKIKINYLILGSRLYQLGFLDGNSISVLLTKVFLLYPGANLIELLERFFLTYSTK